MLLTLDMQIIVLSFLVLAASPLLARTGLRVGEI